MSEAKKQWDAHVEGALAAKDSISVVDLEWDAAVLYAHNRITALLDRVDELEGGADAAVSAFEQHMRSLAPGANWMMVSNVEHLLANIRAAIDKAKKQTLEAAAAPGAGGGE